MTYNGESGATPETAPRGWQSLSEIFATTAPLLAKLLYLPGYEFSSNIYALTDGDVTLIDPGNDYTAYMELWKLGFKPGDIKKIVLTHGHLDHAMGALELLRSYPRILETGGFGLIVHEASPRQIKEGMREAGMRVTEVRGGEQLDLSGFAWEVIHTPGHTIDGICLYHAPSKTVITGDTVLPHAMAEPDTNAGGRLDHYLMGIRALLTKQVENVLPGHGLPIAGVGRQVIEQTYESLMMKVLNLEEQTPWMVAAMALVEKGLLPEGLFCCDKALALNPADGSALELKALCLNDLGSFQEALAILDQLAALRPQAGDVSALLARGYALMGIGQYDQSIALFDQVLDLKPGLTDALVYKGMALYLSGNYEGAMQIEPFQKEFVARFRDELLKRRGPST